MALRLLSTLVVIAVATGAGVGSAAEPAAPGPTSASKALAVRIVFPNGRVTGSPAVAGDPGGASVSHGSFAYPRDGSVIVTGTARAAAKAITRKSATASSSAGASFVSIFEGEITADSVSASSTAATGSATPGGAFAGTGVTHLEALGRPHAFGKALLAGWGYLTISSHTVDRTADPGTKAYDGVSVGLDIHLTAAHGGLPAGTEIQVAYAGAQVQTAPPVVPEAGPVPGDQPGLLPPATGPLVGVPQIAEPILTAGPYDFPVYGRTSFADRYGDAARTNTTWQHGVDIFGQLGQPIVAAAAGTLYSVGWNHASGNRLRLRDRQGNVFLYAHLSAFSTIVANGAHVRLGQVIGFMGDTGNAQGLPTHLHFELTPVSMLFLGFDGAVDPSPYLRTWHRIASLAFPVATGWAPKVPGTLEAPEPGAVLIGSSDISTADGLDPRALRDVLRPGSKH